MRKLATIREIYQIEPIENADAIEVAYIDGWKVVIKKGEFNVGDMVIYIEIDSWIPHSLAPFLSKGQEPREYMGVKGERLRTVKLRGQISQGLVLPPSILPQGWADGVDDVIGFDVSDILDIVKYDPPVSAQLAGAARGSFPSFGVKTDQERIQNCFKSVSSLFHEQWDVEEKMDGSSCSIINYDGEVHVCSRNLSLKLDDDGNTFVKTARESGLLDAVSNSGRNIQISGELCGEGIQGNRYNIKGHKIFVYEVYDLNTRTKLSSDARYKLLEELGLKNFDSVPHIATRSIEGMTCSDLLVYAEAPTHINPKATREGLVFKNVNNPNISFKAISNLFLVKGGD